MKVSRKSFKISLFVAGVLFGCSGCGGGGGSSSVNYAVSGVAVDPYISGAVFCEDKNGNDGCDSDEQISTTSDKDGNFYFSNALVGTGQILMKDGSFGKHNGTDYDLQLAIPITSSATNSINVTPMTTLMARGDFNTTEIVNLGAVTPGSSSSNVAIGLTEADVVANPMTGLVTTNSTVTTSDLRKLRAQLASYVSLRAADKLQILNNGTLTKSQYKTAISTIYGSALNLINEGLNDSILDTINGLVPSNVPKVTINDITKTAIVISDRLADIGVAACISADSTTCMNAAETAVRAQLLLVNGWGLELGQGYYGVANKSTLQPFNSYLPQDVQTGLICSSGIFYIDSSDTVQCQP